MEHIENLKNFEYFKDYDFTFALDSLTKVLNRETIVEYTNYLIENNIPFSYCITDLDNFKLINDNFGHSVGDRILINFAKTLTSVMKDKGVIGRFGGDEFIIVFENISLYEDIWNIFHNLNFKLVDFQDKDIPNLTLTTTSGISRFPKDAKNYNEIFTTADKALYRGKMKGRNCFIIYLAEKHKNIKLNGEKDKKNSTESIQQTLFYRLTQNHNLKENLDKALWLLINQFMFDHVCIETQNEMLLSKVHSLSRQKEFNHIDVNLINNELDSFGIFSCKNTSATSVKKNPLVQELKKQNIFSTLIFKIEVFGKCFGYLRIDATATNRLWQTTEINIIYAFVNHLALILYYKNASIEMLV